MKSQFLWFHYPNWKKIIIKKRNLFAGIWDVWISFRLMSVSPIPLHPNSTMPLVHHQGQQVLLWTTADLCSSETGCQIRLFGGCIQAAFSVSPVPAQCPAWQWPESESSPSQPAKARYYIIIHKLAFNLIFTIVTWCIQIPSFVGMPCEVSSPSCLHRPVGLILEGCLIHFVLSLWQLKN